MGNRVKGNSFYWHMHHEYLLDLVGPNGTAESKAERLKDIGYKPANEQATRRKLFRAVRGALPKRFLDEVALTIATQRELTIYDTVLSSLARESRTVSAILALHRRECRRCPWKRHRGYGGGLAGSIQFPPRS